MAEFEINGIKYRSSQMNAMKQFNVVRRLAPILDSVKNMLDMKLEDGLGIIAQAISNMSDADTEYVIGSCMAVVTREQPGGAGWAKVWSADAKAPMFSDIDMAVMLRIVFAVIGEAIVPFFGALPSTSQNLVPSPAYEAVALPDGMSWLMRPVLRGLCKFESLKDGTLDICDIALMNEALNVADENQYRAQQATQQANGGR